MVKRLYMLVPLTVSYGLLRYAGYILVWLFLRRLNSAGSKGTDQTTSNTPLATTILRRYTLEFLLLTIIAIRY
jgi:hypothetical protein